MTPLNTKETNVTRQQTDSRGFCFLQTVEFFLLLSTFFLPALTQPTNQHLSSVSATATLGGELDISNGEQLLRPKETFNYIAGLGSQTRAVTSRDFEAYTST